MNKFKELYFNSDKSKREKALKIKKMHIPKKIYCYSKINNHFWENIIDKNVNGTIGHCLRMTSPMKFNDPYDTLFHPQISKNMREYIVYNLRRKFQELYLLYNPNNSEINEIFENLLNRYLQNGSWDVNTDFSSDIFTEDIIRDISYIFDSVYNSFISGINEYGVKCFSTNYDSILMWSHYAGGHTGVCFEYDLTKVPSSSDFIENLFPVYYGDNVNYYLNNMDFEDSSDYFRLLVISQSISKAADWKYENEWRFVMKEYSNKDCPVFIRPSRIFLGAKINPSDVVKLKGQFEYCDTPFVQMGLSVNSFKLVFTHKLFDV